MVNEKEDKEAKKSQEPFVPYGTMFKLSLSEVEDGKPRQLECVYCGLILEWRVYTIAPEKFDVECPECKMEACDFWKGKLHQELDPDA